VRIFWFEPVTGQTRQAYWNLEDLHRPEPLRPMDTSDIDPGTGEEFGVIPEGQVWVEVVSTRDSLGRVAFRAYHADGTSSDYDMRLSEFERAMHPSGTEVKVLTRQQAAAFHAARTEATS